MSAATHPDEIQEGLEIIFGDRSNLGASIANVQCLQVKQVKKVKLPCAQASSVKALLRLY